MSLPLMIVEEMDPVAFQAGIFMSKASVLGPVAVYAPEGHQGLRHYFEIQKEQPSSLIGWVGPAGVGQYSLKHGPAGVLGRLDIHFRFPTSEEMHTDFDGFGDQVVGPRVDEVPEDEREKYDGNAIFQLWGEDHYFIGPPRIVKSVLLSRVFAGDKPNDISELVDDIEKIAETDTLVVPQSYHLIHAIDGLLTCTAFPDLESYDGSKVRPYGFVKTADGTLTYYPGEDESTAVDFSVALRD